MTNCKTGQHSKHCPPIGDSLQGRDAGPWAGKMKRVNPCCVSANKELPLPSFLFIVGEPSSITTGSCTSKQRIAFEITFSHNMSPETWLRGEVGNICEGKPRLGPLYHISSKVGCVSLYLMSLTVTVNNGEWNQHTSESDSLQIVWLG